MKYFTFLFCFMFLVVQGQTFPEPYCNITDAFNEEITYIQFNDANITNNDIETVLVDHTDVIANLTLGENYSLHVQGNTYGTFENNVFAFIDWNQNGILDDEGEVYEVGVLFNTTGNDETSVNLDIFVPLEAELGETRIRIIKIYSDDAEEVHAIADPCAISMSILDFGIFEGYGQAIDFTLNIEEEEEEEFPAPYCEIPDDATIEEITFIEFGESSISNSNANSILLNHTETISHLMPGETYTLSVKGNTYGQFDNIVYAFIDWNQNGILDDEGEIYEVGILFNSTGYDDVTVSLDITVPLDALVGETRIRVSKIYTDDESIAVADPCDISMSILDFGIFEGYGQAIDFTLDIGALSVKNIQVSKASVYPIPTQDILHIKLNTELKSIQIFNILGQQVLSQNDLTSEVQLNISHLKSGVYFVKLTREDGKQENLKIIKK